MLRVIELPIDGNTFDGKALRDFQDNPSILREYFALFVSYLRRKGNDIGRWYLQRLTKYREKYRAIFKDNRYVDDAVLLHVVLEALFDFSRECHCKFTDDEIYAFKEAIISGLNFNSTQIQEQRPEVRFVKALWDSINTNTHNRIADCEDEYVGNEDKYIGFKEDKADEGKLWWIRFDDAMAIVREYYAKLNDPWYTKATTIKEKLLEAGLSKGHLAPAGKSGNQYLLRAKKGERKRMLVLFIGRVKEVLVEEVK